MYMAVDDALTDNHASSYATPDVDSDKYWDLINSLVGDGTIIFEATRDLDTGDLQDYALYDNSGMEILSHYFIVAWGDTNSIQYHGQNSVRFCPPSASPTVAPTLPTLIPITEPSASMFFCKNNPSKLLSKYAELVLSIV